MRRMRESRGPTNVSAATKAMVPLPLAVSFLLIQQLARQSHHFRDSAIPTHRTHRHVQRQPTCV